MDCETALLQLESVRPKSDDLALPELNEAAQHLNKCDACARQFSLLQKFDQQISVGMCEVDPPLDLKARIFNSLELATSPSRVDVDRDEEFTVARRRKLSRRTWLSAAVASVLVCGGLIWTALLISQPQTDLRTVRDRFPVRETQQLAEFDSNFTAPVPGVWARHAAFQFSNTPKGWSVSERERHIAAVYRFSFDRSRRQPIQGTLLVFRRRAISDSVESTGLSFAEIRYSQSGKVASSVWTENNLVYVVLVEGGAGQLEQLQQALQPRIG